jgi:dimethylhistidine N-methyltransferase
MPSPSSSASDRATFAAEVAESLRRRPRELPPRYFYDDLGSALFDAICRLPWYRVTRAESALLARHARRITESRVRPLNVVELGCGNGEKLAVLAERAGEAIERMHLIDISVAALENARARLAERSEAPVTTFQGTYEEGLARLSVDRVEGAWLVLFLGSNIGNFNPAAGRALLRQIRDALTEGDALLLGTDLVKPEKELQLAYDDPLQVTAAFNKNLLRRINEELGGTFDLDGFSHRAVWNAFAQRVELHLVCTSRQRVRITAIGFDETFEPDEWIWTESSYKYESAEVIEKGRQAGFADAEQWIDEEARFALTRFQV